VPTGGIPNPAQPAEPAASALGGREPPGWHPYTGAPVSACRISAGVRRGERGNRSEAVERRTSMGRIEPITRFVALLFEREPVS
jgi:hypothetical protein